MYSCHVDGVAGLNYGRFDASFPWRANQLLWVPTKTPYIGEFTHPTFNDGNPYNGYINPIIGLMSLSPTNICWKHPSQKLWHGISAGIYGSKIYVIYINFGGSKHFFRENGAPMIRSVPQNIFDEVVGCRITSFMESLSECEVPLDLVEGFSTVKYRNFNHFTIWHLFLVRNSWLNNKFFQFTNSTSSGKVYFPENCTNLDVFSWNGRTSKKPPFPFVSKTYENYWGCGPDTWRFECPIHKNSGESSSCW